MNIIYLIKIQNMNIIYFIELQNKMICNIFSIDFDN